MRESRLGRDRTRCGWTRPRDPTSASASLANASSAENERPSLHQYCTTGRSPAEGAQRLTGIRREPKTCRTSFVAPTVVAVATAVRRSEPEAFKPFRFKVGDRMRVYDASFSFAFAATALVSWGSPARAADPIAADCLAARDASIELSKAHSLRVERAQLLLCAAAGCPRDIRLECTRRLDEVNAATPTILFVVTDSAGNDLSSVAVTIDGEPPASRLAGFALPVDPGSHVFTFETDGQKVEKHYFIDESQKMRRELVVFGATHPSSASPGLAADTPSPGAPTSELHQGLGTREKLTLGAAVVSVAGLGTGAFLGALAWIKRDTARNICPNAFCADESGSTAWNDAKIWGDGSTIAFIVGGAAAAGAAVFWLSAKAEPRKVARAHVGLGLGGLVVRGRW